ncbi:MAG TPA: glycosyltransferase [Puia sp.]|nr:glycosyltransferase [Puia sp.]
MIKVSVLVSLYRCQKFLPAFLEYCIKTNGLDQIEFLLLHNDPQQEEVDTINKYISFFPHLSYEKITAREGLYATWNRGIKLAKGEYITVWNVDDIRFPDSILQQAKSLDDHPDCALVYGDMYCSKIYGEAGSKVTNAPAWTASKNKEFYRTYHMSCFQMWRKSVHSAIGYYDEQFRCSADFDFQIRTALHFPFVKAPELLGIYLEAQPHKLSSNGLQRYENNVIHLRYGAYENLDLPTLAKAVKLYSKEKMMFYGKWVGFEEKSPFKNAYKLKGALIAAGHFPLSFSKLTVKRVLRALQSKKRTA